MAKGKKGKKDAAKEAEAAHKRELEEKRLAEEKRKKEAEERARLEKLALAGVFETEGERLKIETSETREIQERLVKLTNDLHNDKMEEISWKRFLTCDRSIDVGTEKSINSFLARWEEEYVVADAEVCINHLAKVREMESAYHLVRLNQYSAKDRLDVRAHAFKELGDKMMELLKSTWDTLTVQLLVELDYFPRESDENFQMTLQSDNILLGLWANTSKNPRFKTIEFPNFGISSSIPKQIVLANAAIRLRLDNSATMDPHSESYSVVGPLLLMDLMEVPPLSAKTSRGWTIRHLHDGRIKHMEYPFAGAADVIARDGVDKTDSDKGTSDEGDSNKGLSAWALSISYFMPVGIYLKPELLKVMWWDEKKNIWSSDGIDGVEYTEGNGELKFRTIHFSPIATVLSTTVQYPLKHWGFQMTGPNQGILVLEGVQTKIEILVQEGKCTLLEPKSKYLDEVLKDQESPTMFFNKLSNAGLNFSFPDNVEEGSLIKPKSKIALDQMSFGLSNMASMFQFRINDESRLSKQSQCAVNFLPLKTIDADNSDAWKACVIDVELIVADQPRIVTYSYPVGPPRCSFSGQSLQSSSTSGNGNRIGTPTTADPSKKSVAAVNLARLESANVKRGSIINVSDIAKVKSADASKSRTAFLIDNQIPLYKSNMKPNATIFHALQDEAQSIDLPFGESSYAFILTLQQVFNITKPYVC